MANTTAQNGVGPSVEHLKNVFGVQQVPLASNFSDLIDVADVGRKAAGLSPEQDGNPGPGLQLDATQKLAVRLKQAGGIAVANAGLGIVVDASKGIKVDDSGVGVVADSNQGIQVNANGIGVNFGTSLQMANGKLEVASNAGIPKGLIVMFSGAVIPQGWALCDGSPGRPDLRNRFILGGSASEVGSAGGGSVSGTGKSKTYSVPTSTVPAGAINVTVGNTTLTVDQMPSHNHSGKFTWNTGGNAGGYTSFTQGNTPTPETRTLSNSTGGNKPHSHTGSATQGSHGHTVSTLPAYYILAFIMKL
jgi:microcystin-dependent protein